MSLYPTPDPSRIYTIPGGVAGVRATLAIMQKLAREGRKDPGVIAVAEQVVRDCPANDTKCEIGKLFYWTKSKIRYLRDVRDVEKINTAERTLRVGTGDCDDMSVLLASLLEAVGNKTRFVVMGFSSGEYEHVVTQVRLGTGWITLDPTVAKATLGWVPPNVTRRMVAHV